MGSQPDSPQVVPDLVPARMLNEYAYCSRLFFLEWVQDRFVHSDDTVEGRYHHRAVDREQGAAPLPDDGEVRRARSVLVSSEELGAIARVDVVEGDGGQVVPVDTKRGSPPDIPEGAWEPERVQVCIQGLLLREAGYQCQRGEIYFAGARRRVTVEFDDQLIARTLELLREARQVAAQDLPPPPLVDSPKCPRCSLVGICLPDETNMLADRADRTPRKLLPRDPSARPLYITEQGARLSSRRGRLEVVKKRETIASVRPIDVSQVSIYGNAQVTTQALRALFRREVPVCYFTYGGWFSGIAHGLPSKHVELRRRQVIVGSRGGLAAAKAFVAGKVANQRTLLRRNARTNVDAALAQLKQILLKVARATSVQELLGLEGAAARSYFGRFTAMFRGDMGLPGEPFAFDGRNRRPPKDAVNCLLSFVYALLVKDLTAVCLAVGFDPYMGLFHRPRFGRPALALDLAEEFRPLVGDSVVIGTINNGEVRPKHFVVRAGGVALTREGRHAVIDAYERRLEVELRHPWFGYTVSYRRLLEVQTRILGAYVLGEVPRYEAVATR